MAEEVVKTIENVDKLFSEIVVNGEVHKSNRYTSPSAQSASPSSVRSTQGEDVHAVELNDVLHNFSDPDVVSDVQTLQQGLTNETNARYNADQNLQSQIDTVGGNVSTLQGKVSTIESEIPAQASSSNQLADKNFVNSSIATNTANFLGTYTSMADIEAIQNPTNNDYVFLQTTDSAGNNVFSRYKYNAEQEEWLYEYELNNSSFTAEQWATINSGLTQSSVTQEIEDAIAEYVYVNKLPTDAVLHYSFDDVPDYPDGSADLLQTRFTSTTGWSAPSDIAISTENNSLKLVSTGSRQYVLVTNSAFSANTIKGKIVKVKVYSTDTIARCHIQEQNPSTYPEYQLTQISRSGNEYEFCGIMPSNMTYSSYLVIVFANATSKTAYIKAIYIGDGSYSTPVIDNANGQNNGTNNGGIAVQGLSGKGAYFPSAKQEVRIPVTNLPAPTSNDNFTISCWLKINSDYVADTTNSVKPLIAIGSYTGVFGLYRGRNTIGFRNRDSSAERAVGVSMKKDGKWHNYIGVYDGTTHKSSLYEDGVLVGTSDANIADYQFGSGNTDWKIWSNAVISGSAGDTTNQPATLDDLQFFNRALSQEEVTALYFNKANTPKYYDINNYKWNDVSFLTITTAEYSSTYNVLTVAEDMLKENKLRIKYVSVADNSAYKAGAPYYFTVYEIRQKNDTIVVNATNYQNGNVITNGRSRSGSWTGWKEIPSITPPSTEGKYSLRCSVASGILTYSWSTKYVERTNFVIAGGGSKKLLDYLPISSESEKYLITITSLTISYTKVYFGVVQTSAHNSMYYFTQLFNSGNVAVTTQNSTDGLITNNESYTIEVSILKIL